MDNLYIYITPFVGLFGIFIGAFLQAYLAKKNHTLNNLSEFQNKAYADFLKAASSIAVAQRSGERDKVNSELGNLADAKARICTYGHSVVIHHLAEFMRAGGTLQTEREILSFTKLCITIRNKVGMNQDGIMSTDISQLLFSVDVKDTPTPGRKNC
ncbi:hypothetical protein [Marinobacterium lacunae]|uniref:hypothetical protein n=1 Tax=Marinobacterium lacunae TaxID=1232683 RepID=UPI00055C4C43|nr:hypothetical protein [Marinobacterium lacunae]